MFFIDSQYHAITVSQTRNLDRVENGAIDSLLDDPRSDLDDVENAEVPPGHGSVAMEFFPVEFDAFGVARRLPEPLDHGIDRGIGSGDGIN